MNDIERLIEDYKRSVEGIEQIDEKKHSVERDLREQMDSGLKNFNKRIAVIKAEKRKYEEDMEDHIASFMADYEKEKGQYFDNMAEIERYIGVLNGKLLREVKPIEEGDFNIHGCAIRYYDELYDSEFMSLRGLVVENDGSYGLYVIGCCENGNYRYGNVPVMVMSLVGDSLAAITVNCHLDESDNKDELISYYKSMIKGAEGEDDNSMFIGDMIMDETHVHEQNKLIKRNLKLEDFEDILGCFCYKCGKAALTKEFIKEHNGISDLCWHCGNEMVWY